MRSVEAAVAAEDEQKNHVYLYFVPRVIFSYNFLHAVNVLHLDAIGSQIELKLKVKTLCMVIILHHPWESLYTQYGNTLQCRSR